MKKITIAGLLALSLVSSVSATENKDFYIGADISSSQGTMDYDDLHLSSGATDSFDLDTEYTAVRAKIGMFIFEDTRAQLVYSKSTEADLDNNYFKDPEYEEYGLDIIQEFDITPSTAFLVSVGGGVGTLEMTGIGSGYNYEFDYKYAKAGVGVSYQVIENVELLVGADYNYRSMDDTTQNDFEIEIEETFVQGYFGVNFLF